MQYGYDQQEPAEKRGGRDKTAQVFHSDSPEAANLLTEQPFAPSRAVLMQLH